MIKLYPHQEEAMKQTEGFQNVAVYHDMGLGKTFTGSELMVRFNNRINLVVCQKSKIDDWCEHFKQNYDDVFVFNLTVPSELDMFLYNSKFLVKPFCFQIGIINYELAWRRPELKKLQDFTLMLDESSLIQNTTAKQTKFILKLKPSHVILLSGTPVGGKFENLWTQAHLLGWKISEQLYSQQYVNWTLIEAGGMKHKVVDKNDPYKNIDRLKTRLREHGAVFLKTEEVVNLPEKVFTRIRVKAPKEYWKFIKDSIVKIEGTELVGDTTLTKLLYSRQLCSQFNQGKFEAVKDLMESTNDRLIIFYNFNEELWKLKGLCQELGRPVSEINGHNKDLTAYEQEGDSITLCQYQSASKGLNLQKCNKVIYFSLPLSSENFEQSKKRVHRIGQDKTCFYYILTCNGTVEENILQVLEERKDFTDELFKELVN